MRIDVPDTRFAVNYTKTDSMYTLKIKDIQETDAGTYQCRILLSSNDKVTAEVELKIRKRPFISDNSTRSAIVVEGTKVQLECYAGGFPPPKIIWRRDDTARLPTGGSIYR